MRHNELTVLITGAGGFLGNELVRQLLDNEKTLVVAITSQKEKLQKRFSSSSNLIVMKNQDFFDKKSNIEFVDIVFNCAFPRSSKPEDLSKGITFTERIIERCSELNLKKFINISSQSVYSQEEKLDVTEKSEVAPGNFYGLSKFACERIVATGCELSKIHYTNIRLASLTGLNFDVRMPNRFVKAAINKEIIKINGGNQRISYLDVRDAATALIKIIDSNSTLWNPIYNLGQNDSFSLLELVKTIEKVARKHAIFNLNLDINSNDDNFNNLMNSNLFYQDFEWKPKYSMPNMVEELFDYNIQN